MFGATNVASATFFPAKGKQSGLIDALERVGGLLFYADYSTGEINALYSKGSPTATFTATRAGTGTSPGTFVYNQLVYTAPANNNNFRISYAWYDTAGYHSGNSGVMIEGAATNGIPNSCVPSAATWTTGTASITSSTTEGVINGFRARIITATANSSTITSTWASGISDFHSASTFLKRKTGSGNIYLRASTAAPWDLVPLDTTWRRFASSTTSLTPEFQIMVNTSGDEVYISGCQIENNSYATSFIPTSGTILSRSKEVLKYLITKNRNSAEETQYIKIFPFWSGSEVGNTSRVFIQTDTITRHFASGWLGRITSYPNSTDSPNSEANVTGASAAIIKNNNYIITAIAKHTAKYAQTYINGILKSDGIINGGGDSTDYINPSWDDSMGFYVGSTNGIDPFNGVIQSVVIFNRAHNANEVAAVTNLLNGNI